MTIIELPNGIRIHADVVEISSDGSINAYTEEREEETIDPAVEQIAIGTNIHEKLEEFNRLHGTWRKDLDHKELVESLPERQMEIYNWFAQEGPISINDLSEISGFTPGKIYSRIIPLRLMGLIESGPEEGKWRVV